MSEEPSGKRSDKERSPLHGRFAVTAAITIACVALFVLRYVWTGGGETDHLLRMGANYGPRVRAGEFYRLFASAFLHVDVPHILMNTLALWSFGPVLEALLGPRRYLVLYGACALAGSLGSAFVTEPRVAVGASGAVWGLMTAGIALVYRPQGLLPEAVLGQARKRAWGPLALNLLASFLPKVDLLAHLGGGVTGAGLLLSGALTRGLPPLGPGSATKRKDGPLWTALAAITALAMAASVIAAMAFGKPWEAGKPPVLERTAIGATGVTMELPVGLRDRFEQVTEDGDTSYVYGKVGVDPFLFEISVDDAGGALSPDDVETALEELRKLIENQTDTRHTVVTPGRIVPVGPLRAVLRETKLKNDVLVRTFVVLAGAKVVTVRGYGLDGRPKAWDGVEERIAGSIEAK